MNHALRSPFGGWDRLLLTRAGQILIGVLTGAVIGAIVASQLKLIVVLVGAALGGMLVSLALTQPARAFVALAAIVALIPTYAAPAVGSLLFIPGCALAWAVAAVLMWRNTIERGFPFRPTALDILVGLFFLLMWISLSFSEQAKSQELQNDLFAWLGPYLATRLLLAEVRRPVAVIAAAFALVTVIVAPFALLETMGVSNVFSNLKFNNAEAEAFGNEQLRLGAVRAQASFGHPIALSMWVSVSALLSLAMAVYSRTPKERRLWVALAAIGVGVQVMTYSRTGWLILVLGVFLLALTTAVRAARRRLSWVIGLAGVAVFALMLSGNAPSALQIIPSSGGSGTAEEAANFRDSGAYREKLLERALEPGVLGIWGNPFNKVTPAVSSTNSATDNAYIILADTWGLIPTFALFAIAAGLLTAIALARRRDAGPLVALPIAALTSLAGLFFVAFITNEQAMIWLLIGAASAASERALRRSRGEYGPGEDPERRQAVELPPDPDEEEDQRLAAAPVRW
ncbi:MAG: O-antigen ligase family protein [Solirubrobacterales bacterium]